MITHHLPRAAILTSYGRAGRGVLVSRRSPRELVLTRDGKQILELFRGQHPVLDIVIHTIKVSSAGSALVLCSAPSVPQPVFTITEKAPNR